MMHQARVFLGCPQSSLYGTFFGGDGPTGNKVLSAALGCAMMHQPRVSPHVNSFPGGVCWRLYGRPQLLGHIHLPGLKEHRRLGLSEHHH